MRAPNFKLPPLPSTLQKKPLLSPFPFSLSFLPRFFKNYPSLLICRRAHLHSDIDVVSPTDSLTYRHLRLSLLVARRSCRHDSKFAPHRSIFPLLTLHRLFLGFFLLFSRLACLEQQHYLYPHPHSICHGHITSFFYIAFPTFLLRLFLAMLFLLLLLYAIILCPD